MSRDSWNGVDAILIVLGITAVGLFFRLHVFLWRLWIVVSTIWVVGLIALGSSEDQVLAKPGYWTLIVIPPLILFGVVMLLAWVINGLKE